MNANNPLLTIWCPTYNHEKFIAQTIEGFLLQKVNFPIEIIIHDDASTDASASIIRDYELRYPYKIRGLYSSINQFSKDSSYLTKKLIKEAKGKYVALCEGDDYWTDPLKLQKQIDFLEANNDFSACFHNVKVLKNGNIENDDMMEGHDIITIYDLAKTNYIRTCSFVFRNKLVTQLPANFDGVVGMDYLFFMLIAQYGKIKKLPDIMAIYRKHYESTWSSKDSITRFKTMIKNVEVLFPFFPDDIKQILKENHAERVLRFAVFLSDNKLTNEDNEFLLTSIRINMEYFLNRLAILVHENNHIISQHKSLKFSIRNILAIIKNRLKPLN